MPTGEGGGGVAALVTYRYDKGKRNKREGLDKNGGNMILISS